MKAEINNSKKKIELKQKKGFVLVASATAKRVRYFETKPIKTTTSSELFSRVV